MRIQRERVKKISFDDSSSLEDSPKGFFIMGSTMRKIRHVSCKFCSVGYLSNEVRLEHEKICIRNDMTAKQRFDVKMLLRGLKT